MVIGSWPAFSDDLLNRRYNKNEERETENTVNNLGKVNELLRVSNIRNIHIIKRNNKQNNRQNKGENIVNHEAKEHSSPLRRALAHLAIIIQVFLGRIIVLKARSSLFLGARQHEESEPDKQDLKQERDQVVVDVILVSLGSWTFIVAVVVD